MRLPAFALCCLGVALFSSIQPATAIHKDLKDLYTATNETFFAEFKVKLAPGRYDNFTIRIMPEWAPVGAARFKKLVKAKFYKGNRFYKIIPDFNVQFGIHGDPDVNDMWADKTISSDDGAEFHKYGFVVFTKSSPNVVMRSTQVFINLEDNAHLDDEEGYPPIGYVIGDGMRVVESIYQGYGDQPDMERLTFDGNAYLKKHFPKLSFITDCTYIKKQHGMRVTKDRRNRKKLKDLDLEEEDYEEEEEEEEEDYGDVYAGEEKAGQM
mmetsp:Transcript_3537/g.3972  ORF Transcript_3537/g.3972 Transcript_3537/m.3972 type:complete len:267 (-) Transcript_3537:567-1367(-)|eukprot:CAMPEP_0197847692 /NCGR_PEP_ID=MMETSP1438-20131217/6809_1 /TAXON_ID=1461541 /ORGANISM="Pterosperma sp., Strain CCMP1384" /LENGTH=266 /DNA_ID=CAMNT_0043459685 /DNA_START=191 /DNA_END=991 /DNA_ORIENTATION=-